jgi:hypothetical protein
MSIAETSKACLGIFTLLVTAVAGLSSSGCGPEDYQNHYVGQSCIAGGCHTPSMRPLVLAGTVYGTDGNTPAADVRIDVVVAGATTTVSSGSGGNFYLTGGTVLDWPNAKIRLNTPSGTKAMPATAGVGGNCNRCHSPGSRITAP